MRYGSVCSGIEAATVAWHPLGWEPAFFSEIEPAPRVILAHHYPDTPCHGDFTTIRGDEYGPIDLLVGGTPCQDFSIAGLRAGLGGDRGNLSLQFLLLAARTRARWVVWENVPGVFSSLSHDAPDFCPPQIDLDAGDGPADGEEIVVEDSYDADENHALGCFLAGLSELGYGVAYRVLDAQFAGVPQRRRRIFAVGYLGDFRRAAAVLFERHSLSGHPAPRREKGQNAPTIPSRSTGGGGLGTDFDCDGGLIQHIAEIAGTLPAGGNRTGGDRQPGMGQETADTMLISATVSSKWAKGSGGPLGDECQNLLAVPYAIQERAVSTNLDAGPQGKGYQPDQAYTLEARNKVQAVAFDMRGREGGAQFEGPHDTANLRAASGGSSRSYVAASAVRRLTPRECERLQGFPDDYTLVPHRGRMMADGPRYKALGNSMAVPVMRWIGERIQMVEDLTEDAA